MDFIKKFKLKEAVLAENTEFSNKLKLRFEAVEWTGSNIDEIKQFVGDDYKFSFENLFLRLYVFSKSKDRWSDHSLCKGSFLCKDGLFGNLFITYKDDIKLYEEETKENVKV